MPSSSRVYSAIAGKEPELPHSRRGGTSALIRAAVERLGELLRRQLVSQLSVHGPKSHGCPAPAEGQPDRAARRQHDHVAARGRMSGVELTVFQACAPCVRFKSLLDFTDETSSNLCKAAAAAPLQPLRESAPQQVPPAQLRSQHVPRRRRQPAASTTMGNAGSSGARDALKLVEIRVSACAPPTSVEITCLVHSKKPALRSPAASFSQTVSINVGHLHARVHLSGRTRWKTHVCLASVQPNAPSNT